MGNRRGRRRIGTTGVVLIASGAMVTVGIVGGLVAMARTSEPQAAPVALPIPIPGPLPLVEPLLMPKPKAKPKPCTTTTLPMVPTSVSIGEVDKAIEVVALRRDVNNVPGTPRISSTGKHQMAFDLGSRILAGGPRGNALLNAHTWPDGSALGNDLLAELQEGEKVVLRGPVGTICYRVTKRVEVGASDPVATDRYFARAGKPQIAIVVCSGTRLGPGNWSKRTIWYASPLL